MTYPIDPELREQIIEAMPHMYGDCEDCHADLKTVMDLVAKAITKAEQQGGLNALTRLKAARINYALTTHPDDWIPEIDFIDQQIAELTTKKEAQ